MSVAKSSILPRVLHLFIPLIKHNSILQNYLVFKLSFVRRCMLNATLEKVNSFEARRVKKMFRVFNNLIRVLKRFSNSFEKIKTARGYKGYF